MNEREKEREGEAYRQQFVLGEQNLQWKVDYKRGWALEWDSKKKLLKERSIEYWVRINQSPSQYLQRGWHIPHGQDNTWLNAQKKVYVGAPFFHQWPPIDLSPPMVIQKQKFLSSWPMDFINLMGFYFC